MDFPGEKLLIRLWDTLTEKGVGSLLSPWHIRREGRARLEVRSAEIRAIAQAERDAEDIRAGRKSLNSGGELVAVPESDVQAPAVAVEKAVVDRTFPYGAARIAGNNLLAEAIRREVNVAKAVLAAEAELEGDRQEPPPRTVDADWLLRWRDAASTVSSEGLQNLWGSVLAGEIKSPGSFSLRTVDFLKNLSKEEAEKIAKLSRFVVQGFICRDTPEILESEGISLEFLLEMQQLGIISGAETGVLYLSFSSDTKDRFLTRLGSHGRALIITSDDPGRDFRLSACVLTPTGREILRLGTFEAHDGYLRSLGRTIANGGFTVRIAKYEQLTEAEARFFDAEDL